MPPNANGAPREEGAAHKVHPPTKEDKTIDDASVAADAPAAHDTVRPDAPKRRWGWLAEAIGAAIGQALP